ncbi:hypothetical protein GGE46_002503 [Rhizobium etli]|uniref:Uncharacterized protein n=1 Tax=Rhizobium etli TaxID=29449 RepID=A0A7W6Y9K9_RHIET|nr:hypothetical protein [Rhizobium etli]MBB4535753.1 hypothetical protein [Rhizobium etli]
MRHELSRQQADMAPGLAWRQFRACPKNYQDYQKE